MLRQQHTGARSGRVLRGGAPGIESEPLESRNRIKPASSPRVAAENALERKPESFQRTIFPEGLQSILGAGRGEAAAGWCERGDAQLIELYQQDEGRRQYFSENLHADTLTGHGLENTPDLFINLLVTCRLGRSV